MSDIKEKLVKLPNPRTEIEWTNLATAYAEEFCEGENATTEEQLEAWAYLIMTGICWRLQGWFGRNASSLIERDLISKDGTINWDEIDELS
jgi:hypothetical protein